MISVGIFGDLHGNLRLMYQLVDRFEQAHGPLDAIFQAGDFGIWPDKNRIDATTAKKIREGVEESGFLDLQQGRLKHNTHTPCYFVAGNHEDYEYLDRLQTSVSQKVVPIINNRLYNIRNGGVLKIESFDGSEHLIIRGLGGIEKGSRPKQEKKQPRITYTQEELSDCLDLQDVDLLLTHDSPDQTLDADQNLDSLVQLIQPKYHFFGHTHKYIPEETLANRNTKTVGLAKVSKDACGKLNTGCFIVLQKESNSLLARLHTDAYFKNSFIPQKKCKVSIYEIYVESSREITDRIAFAFQENIRDICAPEGPFTGLRNMIELTKRYILSNNSSSERDKKWIKAYEFFIRTFEDYLTQVRRKTSNPNERNGMRDSFLKDSCAAINSMCDSFGMRKIPIAALLSEAHAQAKRTAKELYPAE